MTPLKLGIDIDGCLARFEDGFAPILENLTGIRYPLFDAAFPPVWDWPQHYGATDAQVDQAWEHVKQDATYWECLPEFPEARQAIAMLNSMHQNGAAVVHYVTSRLGTRCQSQSERWLERRGADNPNVIVCNQKGQLARAIGLDVMIDDKPENLMDVALTHPRARLFLVDRPYNRRRYAFDFERVDSTFQALCNLYASRQRPALAEAA